MPVLHNQFAGMKTHIPMPRQYVNLDSFVIYICIDGNCKILDNKGNSQFIGQGETALIPADTDSTIILPFEDSIILETFIA